jgi:hypothetical protein
LVDKLRLIDFSPVKKESLCDPRSGDILTLKVPADKTNVSVEKMGTKRLFPHPRMENWVPFRFSLVVIEPVQLIQIKYSDMTALLPQTRLDKIREMVVDEPNDQQVIEIWIERQRAVQWQNYKKQCVKSARHEMKFERLITNGQYGFRIPGNPKSFKPYIPQ